MERAIALLETLERQGLDKLIEYLRTSNYATARCNEHHTYDGGLVDHSLEVYDLMMERRGDLPKDSIIVCALLHDLGKTCKGRQRHPRRAIVILDKCGFELTKDERFAIAQHHKMNMSYCTHPLRHCLSSSDMSSTGKWKLEHPSDDIGKRINDALLYLFSKR